MLISFTQFLNSWNLPFLQQKPQTHSLEGVKTRIKCFLLFGHVAIKLPIIVPEGFGSRSCFSK